MAHIGGDPVHIKPVYRGSPGHHLRAVIDLQALQTEIAHPLGIVLLLRDLEHYVLSESFFYSVKVAACLIVPEVIQAPVDIGNCLFFSHLISLTLRFFRISRSHAH